MVIDYKDVLKQAEAELNEFKAELKEVATENKVDPDKILESLDPCEAELLQKRIEQLKRWEETDREYGAYRRAEYGNKDSIDRKNAER